MAENYPSFNLKRTLNLDMAKCLISALFGIFRIMAYFSPLMKTLVIHPEDPTTTFLSQIYARIRNKTVIYGEIPKLELGKLIESHDRIFLLGHGSPYGLLSKGKFPDSGFYVIDDSMALLLKSKTNNFFIWCFAEQFVKRNNLSGLNCGMFISEIREAYSYGFEDVESDIIEKSNELFAFIVSKYINEPMGILYEKLIYEYGLLAKINPIAEYNHKRLFLGCGDRYKQTSKLAG